MVKQPWLAVVSLGLLVVIAWYVANRLMFLRHAERTQGTVVEVSASNGRCGGGRRRRSYSCTKFHAVIQFYSTSYQKGTLRVSAGSARGQGMSTSNASYRSGQTVPVIYDPSNISTVYEDSIFGVWGTPIFILIGQLVTGFMSLFEPRRKTSY